MNTVECTKYKCPFNSDGECLRPWDRLECADKNNPKRDSKKPHKSQTRLTTTWVKSDLCGDDFLTCKNCKDAGIKIRRAYRKDYCEMWEYCPKCGAKFVKGKRGKQ